MDAVFICGYCRGWRDRLASEVILTMAGYTKISVNVADDELDDARKLAESHRVTLTEFLRRAMSTQVFLEGEQKSGKDILLRDRETGEIERLRFR